MSPGIDISLRLRTLHQVLRGNYGSQTWQGVLKKNFPFLAVLVFSHQDSVLFLYDQD